MKVLSKLINNIRRTSLALAAVSLLSLPVFAGQTAASPSQNLIQNANLSQLDSNSQPVGWYTDSWGTNTPSFNFVPAANGSAAYLKVAVQNYQSGDAKWWFNPVNVTAGDSYEYSDSYQSDSSSNIWAQFIDSQNNATYQWIGGLNPTATNQTADFNLTVPTGIVKMSIFHVLNSNGYLNTNNFGLYDTTPLPSTSSNLVPNPTLSNIDPATGYPSYWQTDSWGTNNPAFSFYPATSGAAAYLKVSVQNYQSGDAKWWFNPVTATPGDSYSYIDDYVSNASSNVWVRFLDSQNNPTYVWIGGDNANTAGGQSNFSFTAPANAVSITIYHVLNTDGYLQTNNFSLVDETKNMPPCQPTLSNGIYNSSFEETCPGNPNSPAWWNHAIYGQATATFDYLSSGYTGSRSVDINLTSAGGGEAGWYFKPMPITPNQRYQFTFWYDSTTYAYAYTEITLSDGQTIYQPMMSVPASGSVWSKYQDDFITPANAETLTVHIATSGVGQVVLDDTGLQQLTNYASNSFTRPIISIDFDDGKADQYVNGLPVLNQLGLDATFYINGGTLGNSGYMSPAQVKSMADTYGEEIGSHSYYHDNLVQIPFSTAQNEISSNQTYLSSLTGQPIYDFATPYGSYNTPILNYIMQLYQTQRDTSGQLNYKYNFNPSVIHSVLITQSTTLADISNLIQQTEANGGWLVLTYHDIAPSGDVYTISKSTLQSQLQLIKNSGVSVETTHQAFDEIEPQL